MFGTRLAFSMHERTCGEWQLSTGNTHLKPVCPTPLPSPTVTLIASEVCRIA
jgi:hypothetical protein